MLNKLSPKTITQNAPKIMCLSNKNICIAEWKHSTIQNRAMWTRSITIAYYTLNQTGRNLWTKLYSETFSNYVLQFSTEIHSSGCFIRPILPNTIILNTIQYSHDMFISTHKPYFDLHDHCWLTHPWSYISHALTIDRTFTNYCNRYYKIIIDEHMYDYSYSMSPRYSFYSTVSTYCSATPSSMNATMIIHIQCSQDKVTTHIFLHLFPQDQCSWTDASW
jgi:hypothetical protein